MDVYEVGHHGSHNGTTPKFVAAMTPQIAVISCGRWDFGKPATQEKEADAVHDIRLRAPAP